MKSIILENKSLKNCMMILYPTVSILLWGLIFALAFDPVHDLLVKRMGGKPMQASFIIVVVSLAILVILCGAIIVDISDISIRAFNHKPDFIEAFIELINRLTLVLLGGAMLIFFIFIPFFAFKELIRVMGMEKVTGLFMKNSSMV